MPPGIDAFLSVFTNAMNNAAAGDRASLDRSENFRYGERSAENAHRRQKELLDKYYTPEAQLKHLKAAGLSPSLMYGGSGTTGTTNAAQGTGAQGVKSDTYPLDIRSLAETELMRAETENARAQAAEHQAEADRLNGKSEYGNAEIKKLLSEAGLNKAKETYTKAETTLAQLETDIKEATKQDQIDEISWRAKSAEREFQYIVNKVRLSDLEFNFESETYQTRIDEAKERVRNLFHDTQLKVSQKALTDAQELEIYAVIDKISNELQQEWQRLAQDKDLRQKEIDFKYHELEQELAKAWKQMNVDVTMESEKMIVNMISAMIGAAIVKGAKSKSK